MFEGSKGAYQGWQQNQVRRARGDAADAQATAATATEAAFLGLAIAAKQKSEVDELQARVAELEAENAKLRQEAASGAGRDAQVDALLAQHPNSPLLADSGKRFKGSGNVKTKLRLVCEEAFDARARKMGVTNPADYRQD